MTHDKIGVKKITLGVVKIEFHDIVHTDDSIGSILVNKEHVKKITYTHIL
jgi:hypothetical protein